MLQGQIILWLRYLKLRLYLELSHDPGAGSRLAHTLCLEDSRAAGCSSELVRHGCSCCCCFHGIPSCCCYCCSCCSLGIRHYCCSPCCCTVGCCDSAESGSMIVVESWLVGCSSVVAVVWALAVPLVAVHSRTKMQLPSADG